MAAKTMIVAGYGSGISHAVASRFGQQGFKVALWSRTQSKLDTAAEGLKQEGIEAVGFAVDLTDPQAVKEGVARVQKQLGPVTVLFWNPYGVAKGFLDGSPADFQSNFDATVTGLVSAVQALHADLAAQAGTSAVLVTGGGLALEDEGATDTANAWNATTLAVAKSAQRKLVHIMHRGLAKDGIYVVEGTVMGSIVGTPFADANSTITGDDVAGRFWDLYSARDASTWFSFIK